MFGVKVKQQEKIMIHGVDDEEGENKTTIIEPKGHTVVCNGINR
jgi:hypothetical protein